MNRPISAVVFAIAGTFGITAFAQSPSSYSQGTSTQGGFPTRSEPVDFGPAMPVFPQGSDPAILQEVMLALEKDPMLRGADITVQVSGGNVVISGTAVNEAQAAYAKGVAVGIAGASNVEGVVTAQ